MTDWRMLGGAAGGAAGGNALGRMGEGFSPLSFLDAPRKAVSGALMAALGDVPQQQMTPRALSTSLSPLMGMGGMPSGMPMMPDIANRLANGATAQMGGIPQKDSLRFGDDPLDTPWPASGGNTPQGSMIPALLGLAAGVGSAFVPGLAAAAPFIGSGVAGLAHMIGNAISPDSVGDFSSAQLLNAAGQKAGWGNIGDNGALSLAASMATDPLTWAGGIGGGGLFGKSAAATRTDARLAEQVALAHSPPPVSSAPGAIISTAESAGPARMGFLDSQAAGSMPMPPGLVPHPPTLSPAELAVPHAPAPMPISSLPPIGPSGANPMSYKRVDPQMEEMMKYLGWSQEGQGATSFPTGLPDFAQMRGGWVKPRPGAMVPQMPAGAVGPVSPVTGFDRPAFHAGIDRISNTRDLMAQEAEQFRRRMAGGF